MKTSYFSLSAPMIKENFRRFWALPVIAFMIYLVAGVVPILASYRRPDSLAGFVNPLLNQAYLPYTILSLLLPVIAASLVFRYLYSRSSATIMHALPFTRSRLFNSNLLSGLLFSVLPVLLTGVILLCLAKPVYFGKNVNYMNEIGGINESAILTHSNVFSHKMVLLWMGQVLLMVFCIYMISVFAAMLSGSGIIQFFTAIGFNFLATAFMTMLTYYFGTFLFGYVTGESLQQLITTLSPFSGLTQESTVPSKLLVFLYLAGCLVLIVFSSVLYRKRKLERTQKAFVFRGMDTAICYLLTFFGMTLAGLVLFSSQDSKWITYAGFAGGGAVSFIIGRMVVKKSLHIFDLRALKSFVVFASVAVLFLCCLIFDWTGYANRIPDVSQVTKISVEDSTLRESDPRFDPSYYHGGTRNAQEIYRTPENMKAITTLHKDILAAYADKKTEPDESSCGFSIHYYKDNSDLERSYIIDEDFFRNSKAYKKIYESDEFKSLYYARNLKKLKKGELSLTSSFTYEDLEIKKTERDSLLDCMDQDFRDRTYEQQLNRTRPCATVSLTFKKQIPGSGYEMDSILLNVLDSDTRTVKWLQQHKYGRQIHPMADDVKSIRIYACDPADKARAIEELNMMDLEDSSYYKKITALKDKKQIQTVLDTCEAKPNVYVCEITFKKNETFDEETITYYYDKDSAPSFIQELGK